MSRIYFDSNVFSNLRNAESDTFKGMMAILRRNKEYFTIFFSHAHIYDKRKDQSEYKWLDFAFIQELTGDKYICYDPTTSHAEVFVATPLEVYNEFKKDNSYEIANGFFLNKMNYKGLRKIINDYHKNSPLQTGDKSFEFVQLFNNQEIQQAFVEFVKDSIIIKHDGEIWYYDFYTYSYLLLDLLSIKTEDVNHKNEFFNLVIDANHSYYGQYFDLFVTDDKKMKAKSELLYKKYDVRTKVINSDEFIAMFSDFDYSVGTCFDDIFKGILEDTKKPHTNIGDETSGKLLFDADVEYFGYFNEVILWKDEPNDKIHIFLNKKATNRFYVACYREIENVVNLSVKIWGNDSKGNGAFDFKKEICELKNDKWGGRVWYGDTVTIFLNINKGVNNLCFEYILPLEHGQED